MKTITFGPAETYTTINAAWAAEARDDDIKWLAVGNSSLGASLGYTDQNGYDNIIDLDGNTLDLGANNFLVFNFAGQATGNFDLKGGYVTGIGSGEWIRINFSSGTLSSYKFSIHMTFINGGFGRLVNIENNTSGYSKIQLYTNDIESTSSSSNGIFRLPNFNTYIPTGCEVYIEDNFLHTSITNDHTLFHIDAGPYNGTVSARRNYWSGFKDGSVRSGNALTNISNATTDTYASCVDADISATHDEIAFSTDNFVSIIDGNANYGEPKTGSPVYDDATQVTDIPENLVGINGRTVDHMAAGAYTPETQSLPPTDLAVSLQPDGAHITWTNTVQAEFPNTSLYWEDVEPESAFTTAKAIKTIGVTEHIIPWFDLGSANLWYTRARHTEA